jgi:hypothetical protein
MCSEGSSSNNGGGNDKGTELHAIEHVCETSLLRALCMPHVLMLMCADREEKDNPTGGCAGAAAALLVLRVLLTTQLILTSFVHYTLLQCAGREGQDVERLQG